MNIKLFEVRDSMTMIPVMAINTNTLRMAAEEKEHWLMMRAGYGANDLIMMCRALDGNFRYNSFEHDPSGTTRTMKVAHEHIQNNWDHLNSGDVIDVEFILGETTEPKESERLTSPFGI